MAIDGYADQTIEVPGFGENGAPIRTDRNGAFAYNHRFGETTGNWKITVLNNRSVAWSVDWDYGGWDMTIGRDGNRWVVSSAIDSISMYRNGGRAAYQPDNDFGRRQAGHDIAVHRSPSEYSDPEHKHNAVLPVFQLEPLEERFDDYFSVLPPHDFPWPDSKSELDEISLYKEDDGYFDNNRSLGVYGAGADGGEYLFLVLTPDREVRLYGVSDAWFGLYDDESDEDIVDMIERTNQASRRAYLNVSDHGYLFDLPSDLSNSLDTYMIQITEVTDRNQRMQDGLVAVTMSYGGQAFAIDEAGATRLGGLTSIRGVGLDPEKRYVSAFTDSRGVIFDRENDYDVVFDTDFRPKVDRVRGIEWNDATREMVVLWDDDDRNVEQRYASFFTPPFEETFADANRTLREMVTATCIVPDGEYAPGDTVELAAEFTSESFETIRAEATWTVAGIELSAEGIIGPRTTGRISDRLTIGDVETEETGSELDVRMEWSVTRRADE